MDIYITLGHPMAQGIIAEEGAERFLEPEYMENYKKTVFVGHI